MLEGAVLEQKVELTHSAERHPTSDHIMICKTLHMVSVTVTVGPGCWGVGTEGWPVAFFRV